MNQTGPKLGKSETINPHGNFICDENSGLEAYEFADDVKKRVHQLGIVSPPRPRVEEEHANIIKELSVGSYFDGRMPTVIRHLSLDQLSSLYGLLRAYYAYLVFQTKMVAAEKAEAQRQKEFMWSSVRGQYKRTVDPFTKKRPPDQSASDSARFDVRFVDYSAKYYKVNALYEILDAMCEVAESDMKLISRQVTIQQEKFKQKFLHDRFGKRGEHEDDIGGTSYGETPVETTQGPAEQGRRVVRVQNNRNARTGESNQRVSGRRPRRG